MFGRASATPSSRRGTPAAARSSRAPALLQPTERGASPALSTTAGSTRRLEHHDGQQRTARQGSTYQSPRRAATTTAASLTGDEPAQDTTTRVLVKDDSYAVTETRDCLPLDVVHVLRDVHESTATRYSSAVSASLDDDDAQTRFACLVTELKCLVWRSATRSPLTTTYVFPLPASTTTTQQVSPASLSLNPLCHARLVPAHGASSQQQQQQEREPGLLIIAPTGQVRFWHSLNAALSARSSASFDHSSSSFFASADIGPQLAKGELVRGLEPVDRECFVAFTSHARLVQLDLSTVGARACVSVAIRERPAGWIWGLFGGAGSKAADPRAGTVALALSRAFTPQQQQQQQHPLGLREDERLACAVSNDNDGAASVQLWRLGGQSTGATFVAEHDAHALLVQSLGLTLADGVHTTVLDARMTAAQASVASNSNEDCLAILFSFTNPRDSPSSLLSFAIAYLALASNNQSGAAGAGAPVLLGPATTLAYKAHPDPRPLSAPRLHLVKRGQVALVQFVDAFVLVSRSGSFEESFPLKAAADRFVGASTTTAMTKSSSLSLLTSAATLITVDLSTKPDAFDVAPATTGSATTTTTRGMDAATRKLKNRLEQAVYFGAETDANALAFDLAPDAPGDLIAAATLVSQDLLRGASARMPRILDLRAQLADRLAKARTLIDFVARNGMLAKLSQSARRQLCSDGEKLAAAAALWQHVNTRLGIATATGQHHLVHRAIGAFMRNARGARTAAAADDDTDDLRLFFRTKVDAVGAVLELVALELDAVLKGASDLEAKSLATHECIAVFDAVYRAVTRTRTESLKLYGIDASLLPAEPWTSRPALLSSMQALFDSTLSTMRDVHKVFGAPLTSQSRDALSKQRHLDDRNDKIALQADLRSCVLELADYVLLTLVERTQYLDTVNQETSGEGSKLRELNAALEHWRPHIVDALLELGASARAFELAERYRDFASLVRLCYDAGGVDARHDDLVRFYMGKYGRDFVFPLYTSFVHKGLLRDLLDQDDAYSALLTEFLLDPIYDGISWIQHVRANRFDLAAETLSAAARKAETVEARRTALSLCKLAHAAQVPLLSALSSEPVQRTLERAADDGLDVLETQSKLEERARECLSGTETRLGAARQAELVASRVARGLAGRPMLLELYTSITRGLLAHATLSLEDLVDLLTLRDVTVQDDAASFAVAIDLLRRAEDDDDDGKLPQRRFERALESIWRRLYLCDDWHALARASGAQSDEQTAEQLRRTALYAAVVAALQTVQAPELYLTPRDCTTSPSGDDDELGARFGARMTSEQLGALQADLAREREAVQGAIERARLDSFHAEVVRLARLDLELGARSDDVIVLDD